jgi:hypothetical protein
LIHKIMYKIFTERTVYVINAKEYNTLNCFHEASS